MEEISVVQTGDDESLTLWTERKSWIMEMLCNLGTSFEHSLGKCGKEEGASTNR